MRAIRFVLGLALIFPAIPHAHATGALVAWAAAYIKQRATKEAQSRAADAMTPERSTARITRRSPGMDMAYMAFLPPELRDMMQNFANAPPPTKEQAAQLVRDATEVGMLQPGRAEQAEQTMRMLTSDSVPPQRRAMMFAMLKQSVDAALDLKKQINAMSPADRKVFAADMAKEIGAMPAERQEEALRDIESGKVFPRDISDQVRESLHAAAR